MDRPGTDRPGTDRQPPERQGSERPSAVGALLRSGRTRAGLTIADVSRSLRIRQAFLTAIEDGRFGDLPGPAYAVGFLRAYADFLGLDSNEVVRRFRAETDASQETHELHFPKPDGESGVPKAGILLVGLLIAAVGYGGWYVLSNQGTSLADLVGPLPERLAALLPDSGGVDAAVEITVAAPAPQAPAPQAAGEAADEVDDTPPPAAATAPAPPHSVAQPTPAAATAPAVAITTAPAATAADQAGGGARAQDGVAAPAAPEPPQAPAAPLLAVVAAATPAEPAEPAAPEQPAAAADAEGLVALAASAGPGVVLSATEASWVEIRDPGGARLISRVLNPGERFSVPDRDGLVMTVGNAGGLVVSIDGEALPALGGSGTVLRRVPVTADSLRAVASQGR